MLITHHCEPVKAWQEENKKKLEWPELGEQLEAANRVCGDESHNNTAKKKNRLARLR